ncbi:unnamed protein product [Meloidogyne enterolobii]|uniref:Uncharacterized protein n=1 Tax=Meloidogyne enterolobii TaxID=390850 RepID=A0ACB1AHJ1_MELEN
MTFLVIFGVTSKRSANTNLLEIDEDIPCNSHGVPQTEFNKFFSTNVVICENVADKLALRNIPPLIIKQFEFIISLFYKFKNSRNFKKLKKLRSGQINLPIYQSKDELLEKLENNQILLIAGDTGCGKSTQLPQYLLNAGYTKIACTQPRRIACTVALEMLKQFDSEIAYQTRFDKTKTSSTRMLFLTEGVLLRQLVDDPGLQRYNVVILDEVHERNISGDLLVALLKSACQRREDLKLILMSATINIELFRSYFPGAPEISVPGRLFPIELRYMPPLIREVDISRKKSTKIDAGPYVNILQLIDKKYKSSERGDVLIFLNGISEISIIAEACKEYAEFTKKWIILILHSTLSVEEQQKVFDLAPVGIRKCILSTNIAETSVTIDEVRFVIDSGKENLMVYDPSIRTHKLTETWISKASANQRKGRAGRTGPGVCFRLYSEEEFSKMEDFTLPEIKRVSLDTLILQILDMNMQIDVRDFPFLESPEIGPLNQTLESLKSQGVVNALNEKMLTPLGIILARLPVDIPISKMLIYACVLNKLEIALTIAAGLSVQSPFTNRSFRDSDCVNSRQHLLSDIGDPFTLLRVYREWLKLRMDGGQDTRRWARQLGIEETRLFEITKLRRQFKEILEQAELIPKQEAKEWEELSSKERRMLVGEKRKLFDLKKKAGYEGKKTKILREGQHFDTILEKSGRGLEEEEEKERRGPQMLENTQDQIQHLEFSLLSSGKALERELATHKFDDILAIQLKLILAMGIYPQYAVVDPANNFREGHDQFAHTPSKPFVVIHPNSSLGQRPEALRIEIDLDGRSSQHQFIFYGLLLETTKPYLCNTCRIPATFLLIIARNITLVKPNILCCDGFIEFNFVEEEDLLQVLNKAIELRHLLLKSVELKLNNDEYADFKDVCKNIVKFSRMQNSFSLRRRIDPPKHLRYGIFTANGEEYIKNKFLEGNEPLFNEFKFGSVEEEIALENELNLIDEKKIKGKEYFCEKCQKKFWFEDNVQILKHKKEH